MTDELQRLRGVGPKTADILRDAGYETPQEVLDQLEDDPEELVNIHGVGRGLAMKMEIMEERNLKGFRVPKDLRAKLKEAVKDTDYTLTDAVRVLLPDDIEENKMEIPEEEFCSVYVEESVHSDVTGLAGENITALDVLEKYVGGVSSEDLREMLDKEYGAEEDND
jgi:hypothetical protein